MDTDGRQKDGGRKMKPHGNLTEANGDIEEDGREAETRIYTKGHELGIRHLYHGWTRMDTDERQKNGGKKIRTQRGGMRHVPLRTNDKNHGRGRRCV